MLASVGVNTRRGTRVMMSTLFFSALSAVHSSGNTARKPASARIGLADQLRRPHACTRFHSMVKVMTVAIIISTAMAEA